MPHDPFTLLSPPALLNACDAMSFNPIVSSSPLKSLSELSTIDRVIWAAANKASIAKEFCELGSWSFGKTRSYSEIVFALAEKVGASRDSAQLSDLEDAIVRKVWEDTTSKMNDSEREELNRRAQEVASKYGKSARADVAGFATLGAAQLSGFGIYAAGSTLLGALNSALGLGLGFGAFTGLSSAISVAIGPVGWVALGIFAVAKLGAPNWKKVLPVVVLIASQRAVPRIESVATEPVASDQAQQSASVRQKSVESAKEVAETASPVKAIVEQDSQTGRVPRTATRMERIVFEQTPANRKLVEFCKRENFDYLNMSKEDQDTLRQLVEDQVRQETENVTEDAKRERSKALAGSTKQSRIKRKAKELSILLANLEIAPAAIRKLVEMEEQIELHSAILSRMTAMNNGLHSDKHQVPGTVPKVFQCDAGSAGRIYYRRVGLAIRIELIGSKGSQDADYRSLRAS